MTKFAVIICTYRRNNGTSFNNLLNVSKFLEKQTFKDFKIYLIGDNYDSDIEFNNIISLFPKDKIYAFNNNISYRDNTFNIPFNKWTCGGILAGLIGIQKAIKDGCKYYLHLDDDDTWTYNHIETVNNTIEKFPETDFLINKAKYKNTFLPRESINKNIKISYDNIQPKRCNSVHSSWTINLNTIGKNIINMYENRINQISDMENKKIEETKLDPFDASVLDELNDLQKKKLIKCILIPIVTVTKKTDCNIPQDNTDNIYTNTLTDIIKNSSSLNILRGVNKNISERKFHEFTHILYDIRTLLGTDTKNYLEIGSYIGSSASLMLNHRYKTNIYCVDPLNLNPKHYNGIHNQRKTLEMNLNKNNKNNNKISILQNLSNDEKLLESIKDIKIDILFIDGCHRYNSVINDFINYKDMVNSGGYIVFDDYLDYKYSPEVKKAVDFIVNNHDMSDFIIIGSLPNIQNAKPPMPGNYSNEYIIYKK